MAPHNMTASPPHASHAQTSGTWTKAHNATVSMPHTSGVRASGTWAAPESVTVSPTRQPGVSTSLREIATYNATMHSPSIVSTSSTSIPPAFTDGAPF
jgi:hypothetical protein